MLRYATKSCIDSLERIFPVYFDMLDDIPVVMVVFFLLRILLLIAHHVFQPSKITR